MASRRRWNLGHDQIRPDSLGGGPEYRRYTGRLRSQPGLSALARRKRFLRAGEAVERDVASVCVVCGTGIGFRAGAVVTVCPACRAGVYLVLA